MSPLSALLKSCSVPLCTGSSTPFSDESRPGTPLFGNLHAYIEKITEKFFAPGTIAYFSARLREARRNFQSPNDLFKGCQAHGVVDSERPQRLAPAYYSWTYPIHLHLTRHQGICGWIHSRTCFGKTRAVIEFLFRHWGFYFNASSDD
ncbi:MAG: hypothetical protein JOS17DRAFT_795401 [Linnemannia elongata]|nr:MAG: hypothetical protein JOS17DRAFT_795401 [Linnemannia elongata]